MNQYKQDLHAIIIKLNELYHKSSINDDTLTHDIEPLSWDIITLIEQHPTSKVAECLRGVIYTIDNEHNYNNDSALYSINLQLTKTSLEAIYEVMAWEY